MAWKHYRLLGVGVVALLVTQAAAKTSKGEVAALLQKSTKDHPRLFLSKGAEQKLKKKLASDALLSKASADIIGRAGRYIKDKPVERKLQGRRLLGQSRRALERIFYLSYAYRMTGDKKYSDRARKEMLAAASFTDWNPSHFLDVAEMTTALAVGYDWCYGALGQGDRETIRKAIIEKGLKASLKGKHWWITRNNNWNQVCHGGMTLGALATWEDDPGLAATMIERAVNNVPNSMHEYAPDGAYPEGPGYWTYGTSYNVMLIAALESVLQTDFGLTKQPGFMDTPQYYLHVFGPSGYYFNYSDCGRGRASPSPSMIWFASRTKDAGLLWRERQALESRGAKASGRIFPLYLVWAGDSRTTKPPTKLDWCGKGRNPVAFHRSSWADKNASFVAIKAGSPSVNHAHMDVGTFVMDADGVRWADDLGSQSYYSIESKGINLWNGKQGAQRWQIFRLGSTSHNILTVDGKEQLVKGSATITKFSDKSTNPYTIVDLSSIYKGDLAKAVRGVALRPDKTVLIQDEIQGTRKATVRWAMVTRADVKITSKTTALLTYKGKKLGFTVLSPKNAEIKIYKTDPPPKSYDASNKGTRMIGFQIQIDGTTQERLSVVLSPRSDGNPNEKTVAVASW